MLVELSWVPHLPRDSKFLINNNLSDHSNLSDTIQCKLDPDFPNRIPIEHALTDANGIFRIRGLIPGCIYRIGPVDSVKPGKESTEANLIKVSMPKFRLIQMANEDVVGIHFYAMRNLYMDMVRSFIYMF